MWPFKPREVIKVVTDWNNDRGGAWTCELRDAKTEKVLFTNTGYTCTKYAEQRGWSIVSERDEIIRDSGPPLWMP